MNFRDELCKKTSEYGRNWETYISYGMTRAFWHRRRDKKGRMRKLRRVEIIRKDDGLFHFFDSYYGVTYASLAPDDTVTIMHTKPHVGTRYIEYMINASVYSKSQANIKHRLRCRPHGAVVPEGESWHSPAFPLVPGLQFRRGEVLNREIVVEEFRTSKPEVRRAWTKLFAPWGALMKVLAKLSEDMIAAKYHADPSLLLEILDGEPNAQDAEALLSFGLGRVHRYYYGRSKQSATEHTLKAARCVQNALRKEYYEANNGWTWGPAKK